MRDDLRHIALPESLCESVEIRFGTQFGGLEPFLTFLLHEILRSEATKMHSAEQQIVDERLRQLGYM